MVRLQQTMQLASPYNCILEPLTCEALTIGLLSALSLQLHFTDLLFFTETHIYENQAGMHTIPGYCSVLKPQDRNSNHNGLACYFRDSFQCQQVHLPETEYSYSSQLLHPWGLN